MKLIPIHHSIITILIILTFSVISLAVDNKEDVSNQSCGSPVDTTPKTQTEATLSPPSGGPEG